MVSISVISPFASSAPLAIIVGAGASGCAAVKLLHSQKYRVRLLDTKAIPEDMLVWTHEHQVETIIAPHETAHFADADYIIPSPGVSLNSLKPFLVTSKATCMAETEFAWRALEGETIIAITGTSGKTTTTSLIHEMLKAHGLQVFVGGNIGTPLSRYVLDRREGAPKADVLVLELSSFQLQLCSTFRPNIALLLNISENHLDYHADMQEYIDAKMNLFTNQKQEDTAIIYESLQSVLDAYSTKASLDYFGTATHDGSRFTNMRLLGHHNQLNAEAATMACSILQVPFTLCKDVATNFEPIEHRLEYVADLDGVRYVNDSKATTLEALRVALQACSAPILLLAGGVFKGGDLESLVPLLQEKVKAVALFGESRNIFEKAWKEHIPLTWDPTLETALCRQQRLAISGDTVLLAPATSSYDQYTNYMRRGEDFKRVVKEVLPC